MNQKEAYKAGQEKAQKIIEEIQNMKHWESFIEGFLDDFTDAFEEEKDGSVGMSKVQT